MLYWRSVHRLHQKIHEFQESFYQIKIVDLLFWGGRRTLAPGGCTQGRQGIQDRGHSRSYPYRQWSNLESKWKIAGKVSEKNLLARRLSAISGRRSEGGYF